MTGEGKFAACRAIASLREYALISQDRPRVEHYRRLSGDGGQWILTGAEGGLRPASP